MFVTYALAIGLALACIGLYHEVATHRSWSRRSKWWGSLAVGVSTFAVVPMFAHLVSHLALIASCSCAILALSIHGQHPVEVEDTYVETQMQEEFVEETFAACIEEPAEAIEMLLTEESVEESVEEPVMSAEWLNEVITEGFMAKSTGDYAVAAQAFQRAMRSCTDTGLSDMLNEELIDCYANLRPQMEPSASDASELKQGA